VQLDNTQIVIRERSPVELLDLSFQVLRAHAVPLTAVLLLGAAPFFVVNSFLLGWMPLAAAEDVLRIDYEERNTRYFWNMVGIVFLQAPLATSLITSYLGQAVFVRRPRLAELLTDVRPALKRQLIWQGLFRLALPATLLPLLVWDQPRFDIPVEGFGLGAAGLAMVVVRSRRPFLGEIVLLERNPIRAASRETMTVSRRAAMLHGTSGGDLFSRWLGSSIVCGLLLLALFSTAVFLQGALINKWHFHTWTMLHIAFPACLWLVAGYMAIYRFLSYLDLRIHNEGWELDLLLRAEAARLHDVPAIR
jgi:hypothetical protein